jgi:putative hydrolase of the HAD superfamily
MPLDLVAFDGDDTLWHNERSFVEGRQRFHRMLARAGVDLTEAQLDERVNRIELANIDYFGYGVSSFALSLIETAVELTGGRVAGRDLIDVVAMAKQMMVEDMEVFPRVHDVLTEVAASYPVMLITKGDLLHQTSKLDRSGLRDAFQFVEVVSHKTPATYREILRRHRVDPDRFLMVGNTLRSDVLPVVAAGGWAAHIPAALSWAHEHADVPPEAHGRYFEIGAFEQVLEIIERLRQ